MGRTHRSNLFKIPCVSLYGVHCSDCLVRSSLPLSTVRFDSSRLMNRARDRVLPWVHSCVYCCGQATRTSTVRDSDHRQQQSKFPTAPLSGQSVLCYSAVSNNRSSTYTLSQGFAPFGAKRVFRSKTTAPPRRCFPLRSLSLFHDLSNIEQTQPRRPS
jgi:hypothetical protein